MADSHVTSGNTGRFLVMSLDGKAQRPIECYPTKKAALRRAADLQCIVDHHRAQAAAQFDNKYVCRFDRAFRKCIVSALHDTCVKETGDAGMHFGVQYAVRELLTVEITGRPSNAVSALLRGGKGSPWTTEALAHANVTEVRIANVECQI
ncbi:MAG: hypothetical protein JWN94_2629 [Betaproteobacteria bacterium]|nr:hypothetical protein [Betaproteobacteria bacterium]